MLIKVIIISVIILAVIMLAMSVKLLVDPNAKFPARSCALEDGSLDKDRSCPRCQVKDPDDCRENSDQ